MLFQRTDGLHQSPLKIRADTHYFTGSLHLCGQRPFCRNKFVKRQPGQLHHTIIQCGLKAGTGFAGNGILNLIQRIAQGNLRRHPGNGIPCGLAGQCGRTADTGIDFDYAVFKAGGMECKLYITSAGNLQFADNIQGRTAQHLVLLIPQCLGRRHYNTVSGMYTHRVNILHIADCDTVACTIPHHLIFNFFPAGNTPLHQYLAHSGQAQPVCQNFLQFYLVVRDTAAAASQRISRAQYHRIAGTACKRNAVLHRFHHFGSRTGFTDFFHGVFKLLPVFRLLNGGCRSAQQGYMVRRKKSRFLQLHPQIQPGLSAQCGQNTVRLLFLNQLLQHFDRQRFDIYTVGNILICHNRGGVGIHQHHFHAFFFQGAAGLCPRIVKFRGLSDHNGP